MAFDLNWGYYLRVFYEDDINSYSRCKAADELIKKLRNLIAVCRINLQHAQKL